MSRTSTAGKAAHTASTTTGTQQFATFWLEGHLYGLEVEHVQEVLRAQSLTRVPQAPPADMPQPINLRIGAIAPG